MGIYGFMNDNEEPSHSGGFASQGPAGCGTSPWFPENQASIDAREKEQANELARGLLHLRALKKAGFKVWCQSRNTGANFFAVEVLHHYNGSEVVELTFRSFKVEELKLLRKGIKVKGGGDGHYAEFSKAANYTDHVV